MRTYSGSGPRDLTQPPQVRVAMRADASVSFGGGHIMRCLALSEELRRQGGAVVFLGEIVGIPWLRDRLLRAGFDLVPASPTPGGLLRTAKELGLDAVVIDSYTLDPAFSRALRQSGIVTAAIIDGDARGQAADIYIDQVPRALAQRDTLPDGSRRVGGLPYALIREEFRSPRHTTPRTQGTEPHVLCFFGATDPLGATPTAVQSLLTTRLPMRVTAVAAREGIRRDIEAVPVGENQSVTVTPPVSDLPGLAAKADLVVTAAGSSTLDLLCLGAAIALLLVTPDQRALYDSVVAAGLAVGLGTVEQVASDGDAAQDAVAALGDLVSCPARRDELSRKGRHAVDGLGASRAAEHVLGAVRATGPRPA